MPYTRKQERFFHSRGIKHHHDYRPQAIGGICTCGDRLTAKKLAKLRRGKYIITHVKKSKQRINVQGREFLVS